ncbi:uncharacterized protein EDB91DRAFT_1240224 [Suillus paluster]|uniref:uncharacterized protein n=1 Tax=Suillus paluster TaxID=48578 RepID=UPI001B876F0B|nr:uncharacterized protein EDB91DRAFT_1240224 [Suillus paluster]KAG1722400.1 hypothetical protein EDB91DRAFT_1240224 [Suillus paluster]
MTEWNSPCQAKRCKNKVRRYLDKGDARSTGNMRKHVRSCWGDEVLKAADQAKDANERKGKGKVTYSHHQHTRAETRPEYHIPSPSTVSCDVWQVFVRTQRRVATMLQEYDGKVNFTTDGWSSPNHRALVAFSAHFEHKGEPLSIPLDVVEVRKVKAYLSSR